MSPHITPKYRLIMVLVFYMILNVVSAQNFPRVNAILENQHGEYVVTLENYAESIQAIAETLQPKKNKRKHDADQTTLEMSFRVYQKAAVGNRPFGKIRYQIRLEESGGLITCTFSEFNFKKYERSARYGRMMEVKGRGEQIASLEKSLNELEWGKVRWRMEQEVGKYHSQFLSFETTVDHSDTTQQDK